MSNDDGASDAVLKLFDPNINRAFLGPVNVPDVQHVVEKVLDDARKLAIIFSRDRRHHEIAEKQAAKNSGELQKQVDALFKKFHDFDTQELGPQLWSSALNKDVKDLKDSVKELQTFTNDRQKDKQVIRALSVKVDNELMDQGRLRMTVDELVRQQESFRALFATCTQEARVLTEKVSMLANTVQQLTSQPDPKGQAEEELLGDRITTPSLDWDSTALEGLGVPPPTPEPASQENSTPAHITSLELNSLLRPYNENGELTFSEWLEKFTDFKDQQTTPWENDVAVKRLRMFLNGEHRDRLQKIALDPASTPTSVKYREFEKIKKELLESFSKDGGSAIARAELTALRQRHDEPIGPFIQRLKRIVARLDPELPTAAREKRVFEEFMSRVRDDIAMPLRLAMPENLDEARAKALTIESINASNRIFNDNAVAKNLATVVQALAGVTVTPPNTSNRPRNTSSECFYCGKVGHFARECRKKAKDRQQAPRRRDYNFNNQRSGFSRPNQAGQPPRWGRNERESSRPNEAINLITTVPSQPPSKPSPPLDREASMNLLRQKHARLLERHSVSTVSSLHPGPATPPLILALTVVLFCSPTSTAFQPMICQNKFGQRLIGLPEPPPCPRLPVKAQIKPSSLLLEVFRENEGLSSTPAQVCQVVKSQVRYFTTLSGVYVEQVAQPVIMPVTHEQCKSMLQSRRCDHGIMNPQKEGWATSNNFLKDRPWAFFGSFAWKSQTVFNCLTFEAHIQYNPHSHDFTSTAGTVKPTNYTNGYANLYDGSAIIWKPRAAIDCAYTKVGSFLGKLMGEVWIADSHQFALTISPEAKTIKSCNNTLVLTPQGFAIPLKTVRSKRQSHPIDAAALSAELQALEQSMVEMLQHNMDNAVRQVCALQRATSNHWKLAAVQNPTLTLRSLLRNRFIHATMLNQDIAEVYPCRPIPIDSVRPRSASQLHCTRYIPIFLSDPIDERQSRAAYIDPITGIISDHSPTIPCDTASSFLLKQRESYSQITQHDGAISTLDSSRITWLDFRSTPPGTNQTVPLVIFSAALAANLSAPTTFQHWQAAGRPELHMGEGGARPDSDGFLPESRLPTLLNLVLPQWSLVELWLYFCATLVTLEALSKLLFLYLRPQWNILRALATARAEARRAERDQRFIQQLNNKNEIANLSQTVFAVNQTAIYAQLPIQLNGVEMSALIDTGASLTLMSSAHAPAIGVTIGEHQTAMATSASGHSLCMQGTATAIAAIGGIEREITIAFTDNEHMRDNAPYDIILGCDSLAKFPPFAMDLATRRIHFGDSTLHLLTPQQMIRRPRKLCASQRVQIPPESMIAIPCNAISEDLPEGLDLLAETTTEKLAELGLDVVPTLLPRKSPSIIITNPTKVPIAIFRGQTISVVSPVPSPSSSTDESGSFITAINQRTARSSSISTPDPTFKVDLAKSAVDEIGRKKLEKLVSDFSAVFATNQYDLGCAKVQPQNIHTTSDVPVYTKPHRIPFNYKNEFDAHIDKLLQSGAMRPSQTPWVSPVVLVKKKDGTLRPCIDFRKLNAITIPDRYPMPAIEDVMSKVGGCGWYSSLDLASGYWQIPLSEEATRKCGVITYKGVYEMTRMPFGLVNATSIFSRVMASVLTGLDERAISYVDDVLVFTASQSLDDHIKDLETVFQRFQSHGLKLSPKKCILATKSLTFLGHTLDKNGYRPETSHLDAINSFPVPNTVKKVRQFLGMAAFYHKFIPTFAQMAEPLYEMFRGKPSFQWGPSQQKSFEDLKKALITEAVLAFPDYNAPFHLFVDGSLVAMGASLMQEKDGAFLAIAHCSRTLAPNERKWPAVQIELAAIVWALRVFRAFCYGAKIVVHSDHKPLSFLAAKNKVHPHLQRWTSELQQYDLEVIHIKGEKNTVADALSRIPEDQDPALHPPDKPLEDNIDFPRCLALQEDPSFDLKEAQRQDPTTARAIALLTGSDHTIQPQTNEETIIFALAEIKDDYLVRICNDSALPIIPEKLRKPLFTMLHAAPHSGAHLGLVKTLDRLRRFYWPNMTLDCKLWHSQCAPCQQFSRPIKPFRTPVVPWANQVRFPFQIVGLDLCGPLPPAETGEKYILNMVDLFSKYIISVPLRDATANSVATAILQHLVFIHGAPSSFLSDNGPCFKAELFKLLAEKLGITHLKTVPHHSTGNGAVERSFRTYHSILAKCTAPGDSFTKVLSAVTFAYNCSTHSTTAMTPFYLVHGRDPQLVADILPQAPSVHTVMRDSDLLSFRADLTLAVRLAWEIAREENEKKSKTIARAHDFKMSPQAIVPGMLVMQKNFEQDRTKSPKQQHQWKGVFRVIKTEAPHAWIVPYEEPQKASRRLHMDQCKPFKGIMGPPTSTLAEGCPTKETPPPTHNYNLRSRKRQVIG